MTKPIYFSEPSISGRQTIIQRQGERGIESSLFLTQDEIKFLKKVIFEERHRLLRQVHIDDGTDVRWLGYVEIIDEKIELMLMLQHYHRNSLL